MTRVVALNNLNDFIRRFQLTSGFGLRSYGKGISKVLYSHSILEIGISPNISVRDLSRILNVPQSTSSRIVAQLKKEGMISLSTNVEDKRQTTVSLTKKGNLTFDDLSISGNQMYEEMIARMSKEEGSRLLSLQNEFANALSAYPTKFPPFIPPLRQNVIRITRGLRLLRGDLFHEFSLSILAWHFLVLIDKKDSSLSAKDLCDFFRAPKNTVASVLNNLEKRQLILRQTSSEDSRRQNIEITGQGLVLLKKITQIQVEQLEQVLSSWSLRDILSLAKLSELLLSNTIRPIKEVLIVPRLAIRLLESASEIALGYNFLEKIEPIPFARKGKSILVGLLEEKALKGVCELMIVSGEIQIMRCFLEETIESLVTRNEFIRGSHKLLSTAADRQ